MPGRLGVYLPYLNCLHEYLNPEIRRQADKSRPGKYHVKITCDEATDVSATPLAP